MDKFSYGLGLGIGQQLLSMGAEVSVDDFAQAIRDVLEGKETALSFAEAQQIVNNHFAEMEKKAHAAAIEQSEMFLKMNKERAGVTTLPSGLQYEVLATGTGRKPKATDKVRCHYEGRLTDGSVFDSSYQRGEPADFGLNQVIAGWTEGVQLMKEGAKYRFHIPYLLGYGERGAGASIPPYATLVFDVELIKVL